MDAQDGQRMTDLELERDWKPSRRPQSTIARNFSAELDDLFKTDGGLDSLSKNVFQKKQEVTTQNQELEALEAKLRETEERLKRAGSTTPAFTGSRQNSQHRTPIKGTFDERVENSDPSKTLTSPPAQQDPQRKGRESAPGDQASTAPQHISYNAPRPVMPGTLPETPQSHTSREYVMVDRPRAS